MPACLDPTPEPVGALLTAHPSAQRPAHGPLQAVLPKAATMGPRLHRPTRQTRKPARTGSSGCHKYLGAQLNPDRCYCDGCQTPDDEQPILVVSKYGCNIQKCAVRSGLAPFLPATSHSLRTSGR